MYHLLNLKQYFPNIPKYVTKYVLAFYSLSLILRTIVLFQQSLARSSRDSVSSLNSFPVNELETLGAHIIVLFEQSLALSSRDTVSALDSFPVNELEILREHGSTYF